MYRETSDPNAPVNTVEIEAFYRVNIMYSILISVC